jgi:hypothetical protein
MSNAEVSPRLYLVLWLSFLVLVPFYFLGKTPVPQTLTSLAANLAELSEKVEGGVPQLADYVMAVLALALLGGRGYGVRPAHLPAVRAFACFLAYAALVNLTWSCLTLNLSILQNTVYYVYGFVVFFVFLALYARFGERLLRLTFHGVAASLLLQAVLSPVAPDPRAFRRILFFNNPNQLGYYAVVGACLFYLGTRHFRTNRWYQACVYAAVTYLALLSLSKTALLSLGVLAALALLERPLALLLGPLLLGFFLAVTLYVPRDLAPPLLRNLQDRMTRQEVDETIAGRGYDRFVSHPEYVFFGAGEGDYPRFRSELISELHSSFGTILFCYGVVGAGLFTWGLVLVCLRTDLRSALCLLPVFIFGLAHHGLRFNLFWVLLGCLYCVGKAGREAVPAQTAAAPRVEHSYRQLSTVRLS